VAWTVRCKAKAATATTVICTADRTGRSVPVSTLTPDATGTTAAFADPELKDASVRLGGIVLRMDAEDVDE
jgi:hypothetical protein